MARPPTSQAPAPNQRHSQCDVLRYAIQTDCGQKADAALIPPALVDEIVDEGESRCSDHQRQCRRSQGDGFPSGHQYCPVKS